MECLVCQNAETGHHYGVICCRACAAFFRRTVQMKLIYRCRKNGTCSLRKETRFCCRFCRMKRCIDLGMTTEDNPGPSYEQHLDTSTFHYALSETIPSDSIHEFYNIQRIYEDHSLFLAEFKNRLNNVLVTPPTKPKLPYELSLLQQAAAAYAHHNEQWPNSSKLNLTGKVEFNSMICDYYREFEHVAIFLMETEPFTRLSLQQKWVLMKRFSMRFMLLDRYFATAQLLGTNPDDHRIVALDGSVVNYEITNYDLSGITDVSEEDLKRMFNDSEVKGENLVVKPFKKLNPDRFEFLYLLMTCLWDVENHSGITEETLQIVISVKERLSEEIHFYYKVDKKLTNYAQRIYKLARLLTAMDRLDELRIQDSQLSETFNLFKIDVHLSDLTI